MAPPPEAFVQPRLRSMAVTIMAIKCNGLEFVGPVIILIVRTRKWRRCGVVTGWAWGQSGLGCSASLPQGDLTLSPTLARFPIVREGVEIDFLCNYKICRE